MSASKDSQPIQLAFNWEAGVKPQGPGARVDALAARETTERPMFGEYVMEEVLERHNMQTALRQVRANKGSPGIDGMSVEGARLSADALAWDQTPALGRHLTFPYREFSEYGRGFPDDTP